MKKFAIVAATALTAAVATIGTATAANAAGATTTQAAGSGDYASYYNHGDYSWSSTTVKNPSWNNITTSALTVHGSYGWEQTYSITEKQAKSGDKFTVTGSVTVTTPYGTGTVAVPAFKIGTTSDVPWSTLTDHQDSDLFVPSDAVTSALHDAQVDLVYNHNPGGVNSDYWIF